MLDDDVGSYGEERSVGGWLQGVLMGAASAEEEWHRLCRRAHHLDGRHRAACLREFITRAQQFAGECSHVELITMYGLDTVLRLRGKTVALCAHVREYVDRLEGALDDASGLIGLAPEAAAETILALDAFKAIATLDSLSFLRAHPTLVAGVPIATIEQYGLNWSSDGWDRVLGIRDIAEQRLDEQYDPAIPDDGEPVTGVFASKVYQAMRRAKVPARRKAFAEAMNCSENELKDSYRTGMTKPSPAFRRFFEELLRLGSDSDIEWLKARVRNW